jgi:hypothetical protein
MDASFASSPISADLRGGRRRMPQGEDDAGRHERTKYLIFLNKTALTAHLNRHRTASDGWL